MPDELLGQALQLHRAGQLEPAIALYRQALNLNPRHAEAWYLLALATLASQRPDETMVALQRATTLAPNESRYAISLGDLQRNLQRWDLAAAAYESALQAAPDSFAALTGLGITRFEQGMLVDSLQCFTRALQNNLKSQDAHFNLGRALEALERWNDAELHFRTASDLAPQWFDARFRLAHVWQRQGQWELARREYERLLLERPDSSDALHNLGTVYLHLKQAKLAADYLMAANDRQPNSPATLLNLGLAREEQGLFAEAEYCYRQVLAIEPDEVDALNNLGNVLRLRGDLDESLALLQRAMQLRPDCAKYRVNLALTLEQQGYVKEALAEFRAAHQAAPDDADIHRYVLFCLNYQPELTREDVFEEHRQWGLQHSRQQVASQATGRTAEPSRRLRIGYVSPDVRQHPVARFIEPLLEHHDRARFDIVLFVEVRNPDATTHRLCQLASSSHSSCDLDDAALAAEIEAQGIDLLVDLAGHTSRSRLLVFDHRPAPIQLTYLGYPNTTGLASIDYRLTDNVADPIDDPTPGCEQLVRLPKSFCCYQPPRAAPEVAPLPCLTTGRFTFGSLLGLPKLNDRVLELWGRVMRSVPDTRLLLCRHSLAGQARARIADGLAAWGVDRDQLEFRHETPTGGSFLDWYAEIDVALDSFPWSGHTTACEALWMGVPVITRRGDRHVSRMVASVLSTLARAEWIARDDDEYVAIAQKLAADRNFLAQVRQSLRIEMAASPLCDGAGFTRDLEAVYRSLWIDWCTRQAAR